MRSLIRRLRAAKRVICLSLALLAAVPCVATIFQQCVDEGSGHNTDTCSNSEGPCSGDCFKNMKSGCGDCYPALAVYW